jgi:hypothetical protein
VCVRAGADGPLWADAGKCSFTSSWPTGLLRRTHRGIHRKVPEDGPDVMNSDNDSDNEQHGDEIMDGYIGIKTDAHGNPLSKEHQMETSQADQMRREAKTSRGGGLCSGVGSGQTDTCVAQGHPS